MPQTFTAAELDAGQVLQALPLVRTTWPEVDLEGWQSFAASFRSASQAADAAIVGLFDATGGLCGIFACRREHDLRQGAILCLPLFMAVDVGNSLEPVRALLDAAEARAQGSGCAGLHIRLAGEQGELTRRLRRLGVADIAILASTKIDPAAAIVNH